LLAGRLPCSNQISHHICTTTACTSVPQDVRQACRDHADADRIPWRLAQLLCERSRSPTSHQPATWLHSAAAPSPPAPLFRSPPPRPRPKALTQRLEALQADLDNKRYSEMVADITKEERRLDHLGSEMFPTTRLQLSFGLHVIVTMGAFFALGWYGLRWSTGSDTWVSSD
jgi:hypothetical protein